MPLELNDIIALRKRIAVDRARLEEEEQALTIIERRLRSDHQAAPQHGLDLGDANPKRKSFAQAVRDSVQHFQTEEFDVPMIETLLKGAGIPLPEKNCRARIAMELQVLLAKHVITRTVVGSGSTPHKYKVRK